MLSAKQMHLILPTSFDCQTEEASQRATIKTSGPGSGEEEEKAFSNIYTQFNLLIKHQNQHLKMKLPSTILIFKIHFILFLATRSW